MNVIFLGQGKLSYDCLNTLLCNQFSEDYHLKCIVTSNKFYKNFLENDSSVEQITFISNSSRNEDLILDAIEKLEVEVLISVQHRWILSEKILSKLNGNAFNLHNAKLPEFKGYNSISHAIYSDASKYFVTIHKIDPEVDSGSIVAESGFEISSDETALSLYKKTIPVAKLLFEKFLLLLSDHSLVLKPSSGQGAFYSKNSLDDLRLLKLSDCEETLCRKVRAVYFPPYEPAYFLLNDKKIYCLPDNLSSNLWLSEVPLNKSKFD